MHLKFVRVKKDMQKINYALIFCMSFYIICLLLRDLGLCETTNRIFVLKNNNILKSYVKNLDIELTD